MKTLLFNFENPSANTRVLREIGKVFSRAGVIVVTSEVDKTVSKKAGVTYRNANFTFADGQTVTLAVKSTGDVFEVRVNGKATPLKYQDEHTKAIGEISEKLDKSRSAFQKALARVRTPLPPSIKTSRAKQLVMMTEYRDVLKGAVEEAKGKLAELKPVSV
jgi:hypothetical protein